MEQQIHFLRRQLEDSQNQLIDTWRINSTANSISENSLKCGNKIPIIDNCEWIHICMVCAGYSSARSFIAPLKSILFNRKNPLHLHIIVDSKARVVLQHLLSTWDIPHVEVNFYSTKELLPEISWIPNEHYSGVYGLMKLALVKILNKSVEKIIVLDTDIIINANIGELWCYFSYMTEKQIIGLVDNQSDFYLRDSHKKHPWPAIGKGFNTGVMLIDIKGSMKFNWMQKWRLVAENQLVTMFSTYLADQDIVNALIKTYPEILYRLPCSWNIQLSAKTQSDECYTKLSDIKTIHWNSPRKLEVKNKHAEFFRNLYSSYLEYNGNLLKREVFGCSLKKSKEPQSSIQLQTKSCYEFRKAQATKYRTHLFFLDYDYSSHLNTKDVTLIASLSMDRLQMIEQLLLIWEGPVSVSLYLSDAEAEQLLTYTKASKIINSRKNIACHVIYKEGPFFPVNFLRNVGIDHIKTEYMFLSDIDFLPMVGLYQYLVKTINMWKDGGKNTAWVVPAFETQRYKISIPKSKAELLNMLDIGELLTFRYHDWSAGHSPTNFAKWRTATTSYKVKWKEDFEPYIVVKKTGTPKYDTRFVGFGWNKVSHIMELYVAGFEFVVLPNAFIVHMPHSPSNDIAKFRTSLQYKKCVRLLKQEFIKDLNLKYNSSIIVSSKL